MKLPIVNRINRGQVVNLQQRVTELESHITSATLFVKEIEKGNLEVNYGSDGENGLSNNELASSLVSLRNQLKNYSIADKQRNWSSEGLAQFIDILRSKNNDMADLTDNIVRNLVKYMNANQGALYIMNDEDPKNQFLEMAACYAYDRKKFLNKRFEIGEGLVGQIVLEKETIQMTEIPDNYLSITSGLGHASPRNLLIVPLKLEEKVLGVIELASFKIFEHYHIEFVERLAESIASTIGNVNINQQTKKLLQETQVQAEQMRAQEEEMRQNMEELSATQEEMQRVLKEAQEKETYLNNLLDASPDSIITVDLGCKIMMFNKFVEDLMAAQGIPIRKGMDIFSIAKPENKEQDQKNYERVFRGETVVQRDEYYGRVYEVVIQPLRNQGSEIIGALITTRDLTKDVEMQKQTEELLKIEKQRAEEMRAQEEELRQNMEELSATQDEMQRVLQDVQEKERYLDELINVPKDSIFTVDKNYCIISANKALYSALEAMGIKEIKGFDMLSFYPEPEEKKKFKALYDRAFAGENFEHTAEYAFDGVVSYYTTNYAPLRNVDGEIFAVASFAKDTTSIFSAQKRAEQLNEEMQHVLAESKEKERYLDELINVPKDSIFTVDKNYCILSANKALSSGLEAMGITDVKGFNVLDFYPDPTEKKSFKSLYDRAFKGENFEHTIEYKTNGVVSYYCTNYAPLRDAKGKIFAVASFAKDTTSIMVAQKQAEQLNEEMRAQEEELRQSMEELSATQEDMHRLLLESQAKERYLEELINSSKDTILTVDKDFKIISCNKVLVEQYEAFGIKGIGKGFDPLSILPEEQKKGQIALLKRVFKGETIEMDQEFLVQNVASHVHMTMSPLKDDKGNVFAAAIVSRDITVMVKNQRQLDELLRKQSSN